MYTWKNSFTFVLLWFAMTMLFFAGTLIFSAYLSIFLNGLFFDGTKMLVPLSVASNVPVWMCAVFIMVLEHLAPRNLNSMFMFLFVPLLVGDALFFFIQSDPSYGLIFAATFLAYHMAVTVVRQHVTST